MIILILLIIVICHFRVSSDVGLVSSTTDTSDSNYSRGMSPQNIQPAIIYDLL